MTGVRPLRLQQEYRQEEDGDCQSQLAHECPDLGLHLDCLDLSLPSTTYSAYRSSLNPPHKLTKQSVSSTCRPRPWRGHANLA